MSDSKAQPKRPKPQKGLWYNDSESIAKQEAQMSKIDPKFVNSRNRTAPKPSKPSPKPVTILPPKLSDLEAAMKARQRSSFSDKAISRHEFFYGTKKEKESKTKTEYKGFKKSPTLKTTLGKFHAKVKQANKDEKKRFAKFRELQEQEAKPRP